MLRLALQRSGVAIAACYAVPSAAMCGTAWSAMMVTAARAARFESRRYRASSAPATTPQKSAGSSRGHGSGTSHAGSGHATGSPSTAGHLSGNSSHNGTTASMTVSHASGTNNNNSNNSNVCNSGGGDGGGSSGGGNGNMNNSGGVSWLRRKKQTKKVLKRKTGLKKKQVKRSVSVANTASAHIGGGASRNAASGGANSTSSTTPTVTASGAVNSRRIKRKLEPKKKKLATPKLRVCVLNSSYEGSDSVTADVDNYHCSPAHWVKDKKRYTFTEVSLRKSESYLRVRELVTSNNFDVFFNLCDGGKDEKRAGVEVVEALEEHNAAFTGTDSHSFEPSKIDMKLLVGAAGVNTPNFVLLESTEGLAKKCRHLRFPVIVKHLSGYASVGIHKDNRCDTLDELKVKVRAFLAEFNHALVEEFIRGREGTVLACADRGSLFGVKVFKPLMFKFLQNDDDFAYFEKKWTMECNENAYSFLPHNDPAYPHIIDTARNAFRHIMNGVGYGRVDFRIDPKGDVYFLEINPNCGMWYNQKDGGDFADVMVQGDKSWDHDRFIRNAIIRAVREQAARRPWYFISHDSKGNFSTRASKTVRAGKSLFSDAIHPIPVVAQALYKLGEEDPTVGCVILRGDRPHQAVAIRHSCEPNMQFMQGRTLTLVAKRTINVGEELTVDYATLCDENMPPFACSCGTSNCRSVIFPSAPTPRTLEGKNIRQMLREKKKAWYKEKEDREAERILKKRASKGKGNSGSSASSPSSSPSVSSTSAAGVSSNAATGVNGSSSSGSVAHGINSKK
ncbi:hypothetical protein C3747_20g68 [Trypanosoma cruzi]|uniref:ATP-grasp domain-containing protein n=2 Tax=Trypanosoma cruzi TaxID=5693 RepID=Q4D7T3_TRYCC|nr:hypothetical protein, conserved [Trypanosoma cruzi]EAN88579.1 hypothetical protein, conserved [Trypanosoma cruzi]PWV16984.1 hypothetical protein C3747_20g68 [Trypanosoma cruzi]RNC54489.1 methyltransferase/D-alanine--D-alanine ligase [Trypanosoma cruzi]|eukprot:XP_810430.1 hypothetical protein [Trypanosoma cruzi strain CL Brener]